MGGRLALAASRAVVVAALLLPAGCGLDERDDFLLGRPCTTDRNDCDPGQRCLPHRRVEARFDAFFCRSAESFTQPWSAELPLAYCDPDRGLDCPGNVFCAPDRIRLDAGPRARVCAAD
jgi:hypothetical protein